MGRISANLLLDMVEGRIEGDGVATSSSPRPSSSASRRHRPSTDPLRSLAAARRRTRCYPRHVPRRPRFPARVARPRSPSARSGSSSPSLPRSRSGAATSWWPRSPRSRAGSAGRRPLPRSPRTTRSRRRARAVRRRPGPGRRRERARRPRLVSRRRRQHRARPGVHRRRPGDDDLDARPGRQPGGGVQHGRRRRLRRRPAQAIVIGDKAWLKAGTGRWVKSPGGAADFDAAFTTLSPIDLVSGFEDLSAAIHRSGPSAGTAIRRAGTTPTAADAASDAAGLTAGSADAGWPRRVATWSAWRRWDVGRRRDADRVCSGSTCPA